jgi:hypothetical protein
MTELSLLAKATMLMAAGLIGARIVRRSRASVRHLVLVATFGALTALPIVALVMPSIAIGVPVTAGSDRGQTGFKLGSDRGQTPAVSATRASSDLPASRWPMPGWPDALRMVWAAGAALMLTSLGVALLRLRRIRRTALPCLDLLGIVRTTAAQCGVTASVETVTHERVVAPLTYGIRRRSPCCSIAARTSTRSCRRTRTRSFRRAARGTWRWSSCSWRAARASTLACGRTSLPNGPTANGGRR